MFRNIIRVLLSALAFTMILPKLPGIDFHGNFGNAVILSLVYSFFMSLIDFVVLVVGSTLTIGTLGLALLWIIPALIFGFWLVPATALIITAHLMPTNFSVDGPLSAGLAGLVLLFVSIPTSEFFWKKKKKD